MPLQLKVEKLDDVDEGLRSQYVEDKEGGGYKLAVEGLEDTGALKRAKDHEKAEHDKTKAALKKLQDDQKARDAEAQRLRDEALRASGNVEAIEKSWSEKLTKREQELQQKYETDVGSLTSDVNRLLIENVAVAMANELAVEGSAGVLIPHISARLGVEVRDGKRVTVVKDANGQTSALTTDELKKEFASNKAFAPVLAGSKASGGGANGQGKGGGAPNAKQIKRAEFDALDPLEKAKRMKEGVTVID